MQMFVRLRGIHTVTRRLRSGAEATYYYAWRGGPRLKGERGSPEFIASYEAAHRSRREPKAATFHEVIVGYKRSADFRDRLRPRTQFDYIRQIAKIEDEFGTLPMAALEDPRVTRDFLDWRDSLAAGPRQADYAWTVLMRLLAWARGRGLTTYRPPDRIEHLYHSERADKVWEAEHIAAFQKVAPQHLQHALWLALETGHREGDLIRLEWSAYNGESVLIMQRKSKRWNRSARVVSVQLTGRMRAMLDAMPRTAATILTSSKGRPWKDENSFRQAWRAATQKAGIIDRTFHDLRGTAVTRMSEHSCTPQEIATRTGHSLRDVHRILEHYLARTSTLGRNAIAKIERGGVA